MTRFDVMIGGQSRDNLLEQDVEELYRTGEVDRQTRCRVAGTTTWRTIDECLPILKYVYRNVANRPAPDATTSLPSTAVAASPQLPVLAAADSVDWDSRKPALTSSLKAGWICFGVGAAVAWIFPPGHVFYSVALIMAIVAMCTHQVSRGLILLLSTFVAMGTSVLVSFTLAVGMFAAAAAPAMKQVEEQMQRSRVEAEQAQARLQRVQQEASQSRERLQQDLDRSREEVERAQQELARSLTRTANALTESIPTVLPNPSRRPAVSLPPETPTQHERLAEIARMEAKERQLRRMGRDLDPLAREYLQKLRETYDSGLSR